MASTQVYNDINGATYYIDYTVENAILNGYHTGLPKYYIRVSTSQTVMSGDFVGQTIPAEIVIDLDAPNYDVTEKMKEKAVVIMDKVAGGTMMSSSSSSESTMSTSSSSSDTSLSSGSSSTESSSMSSATSVSSGSSSTISEVSSASSSSLSSESSLSSASSGI